MTAAGAVRQQPAHCSNSIKLGALHKFDGAAVTTSQVQRQLHEASGTPAEEEIKPLMP